MNNPTKPALRHTLAACIALGALMLSGTACTQGDTPLDGTPPTATHLLALGKVTIDGAQAAPAGSSTRAASSSTGAGSSTRAADDKGYIGIRKSAFAPGDALVLTLSNASGTPITATLGADGTTWTLAPKAYYTAAHIASGVTLSAAYQPAAPTVPPGAPAGTVAYADHLVTTTAVPLPASGAKLALAMTHVNAMVEVTPPVSLTGTGTGTGIAYSDLTLSVTPPAPIDGSSPPAPANVYIVTTREGTAANLRHRAIAPAGGTLKGISLQVNGITYTTTLAPEVALAANKRYPIALTLTPEGLKATVGNALGWGNPIDFDGRPAGYTHYIYKVEDLVKFREDVWNGAPAATANFKALQMADIDLGGIDNWTPIKINNRLQMFSGAYNGNGHIISNLTIKQERTSSPAATYLGLFGNMGIGAKITGVHLRNCKITSSGVSGVSAGALVGLIGGGIITLCSATGSIEIDGSSAVAGGLIGTIARTTTTSYITSYITRCSADVAVTSSEAAGGFTGKSESSCYASCIASGKVTSTLNSSGACAGFSTGDGFHAFGCIVDSEIDDAYATANSSPTYAFNSIISVKSCLSMQAGVDFYKSLTDAYSSKDNASVGTMADAAIGTGGITATDAYGALTANDVENNLILGNAKITTLHYSKADGHTLTPVERTWKAKGVWQDKGAAAYPTINMLYEGEEVP